MNIHRGERFQRGRGIGSLFAGLFRTLKPLFSMGLKAGKKMLTSDVAKDIGSTALNIGKEAAKNVAVDLLEGKDMSDTLNRELESAKSKVAAKLKGRGRKKKKFNILMTKKKMSRIPEKKNIVCWIK